MPVNKLRHRTTLTILRLPPEILRLIFKVNATKRDDHATIFSSHVCQVWRDVALAIPQIWTNIRVGSNHAKEFCARSRNLPIHLSMAIKFCYVPLNPADYEWLQQHSDRVASLIMTSGGNRAGRDNISAIIRSIGPTFPLLSHLDLDPPLPIDAATLVMPCLTSLRLSGFSLLSWEGIGNLTSLKLEGLIVIIPGWSSASPTIVELSGILERSPQLRVLHLDRLQPTGPHGPVGHHTIELAHIESLTIQNMKHDLIELLSRLYIPSSAPVFNACQKCVTGSPAVDFPRTSNTQLESPFLPNQIFNISNTAVWFGYLSAAESSFCIQDVRAFEGAEFIRHLSSGVDLSQIRHINLQDFSPPQIPSLHVWQTLLDHMPLLSHIHLRATTLWLMAFIFALWPETEPVDGGFFRRVENVVCECIQDPFASDRLGELLVGRLQYRIRVVGSPLKKLQVDFITEGMLEKMEGLVEDFIYNPPPEIHCDDYTSE